MMLLLWGLMCVLLICVSHDVSISGVIIYGVVGTGVSGIGAFSAVVDIITMARYHIYPFIFHRCCIILTLYMLTTIPYIIIDEIHERTNGGKMKITPNKNEIHITTTE